MATFAVTAEQLRVLPHPNADALELAAVGGYRAVVRKGAFADGQYALYIPEDAVVPAALLETLGLTGRLAGSKRNRVRAVRLRGELSQGIVFAPDGVTQSQLAADAADRVDWAPRLGIVKYVAPVPVGMGGEVHAVDWLRGYTEIENVKRFPHVFEPGEPVVATEKVHGSCTVLAFNAATGESVLSSKGRASSGLALRRDPDRPNVYWRAAEAYGLRAFAAALAAAHDAQVVHVFAEVFGPGVQDLHYGVTPGTLGLALFDAHVGPAPGTPGNGRFLDRDELVAAVGAANAVAPDTAGDEADDGVAALSVTPELYRGPYDHDALVAAADGRDTLAGANVREGLVVRAEHERYSPVLGGRAVLKFVSDDYLTRRGGTQHD